ncbi:MAG: HAD family hydrolase [Bdellovibrionales bacterium RBG_16_40_8]|nr:MAG: HAD family hydrolase [Bdellovibrionales bacterium RBG_16_40_8]
MTKNLTEFVNPGIRFVFTDIDDTLTESGHLVPDAYSSLWKLFKADINVVPVTGRPAGWCELIARQWPVAGVVGENGGFYFRHNNRTMKRHYFNDAATRVDNQRRLERIRAEILAAVPGSAVASDQFCRMMDLAIDFCEDVKPLPPAEVDKIVTIFKKHGANAKVSSIHVNGWFGEYDKLSMCKTFCQREFNLDISAQNDLCAFVGDSPNDEPMFEFFKNSFGVANVEKFMKLKLLKHAPRFLATKSGGTGFTEIATQILKN